MATKKTDVRKISKVTRKKKKFTAEWNPVKDCVDQDIKVIVKINGSKEVEKKSDLAKKNSTYSYSINPKEFKPYTNDVLSWVGFKLKSKAKDKAASDWSPVKYFDIKSPFTPTFQGYSQGNATTFTYSWAINDSTTDTSANMCTAFEWQTCLVEQNKGPTWSLANSQTITRVATEDDRGYTPGDLIYNAPSKGLIDKDDNYSMTVVENAADISANKVRYFRVRARGPQGSSNWRPSNNGHMHQLGGGQPLDIDSNNISYNGDTNTGTSGEIVVSDLGQFSPGDTIEVQYAITEPLATLTDDGNSWMRASLELPNDFDGWTTYKSGWTPASSSEKIDFNIDTRVPNNCCLFMRINKTHDDIVTTGIPFLLSRKRNGGVVVQNSNGNGATSGIADVALTSWSNVIGTLSDPTINHITPPEDMSVPIYTINVTNAAALAEGSNAPFVAVYCATSNQPNPDKPICIIPYNMSEQDVTFKTNLPSGVDPTFKVVAYVADYTPTSPSSTGYTEYTIDTSSILMQSGSDSRGESVPKAAANISAVKAPNSAGTILVTWEWTWDEANATEISWSTDAVAWEATSEPSSYIVTGTRVGKRYITGLSAETYYVRIRFIRNVGDTVIYGAYSDPISVPLSSAPNIPTLHLSCGDKAVTENEEVTATWVYESTDGTGQISAVFASASRNSDNDPWVYTDLSDKGGKVNSAKKFTFRPSDFGWQNGNTYYLSVKVQAASGAVTGEWSNPVPVKVAPKPVITVTGIGGQNDPLRPVQIASPDGEEFDIDYSLALTQLPLTFNVGGAGSGGSTTVIIERYKNSTLESPDDSRTEYFDGETIVSKVVPVPASSNDGIIPVSITLDDVLSGANLNNKDTYKLKISLTDDYGQTVSVNPDYEFTVYWDHFAEMPTADIVVDDENDVVFITPQAEASEGDYCRIYRLSVDRPQLVLDNGTFGQTYVDRYPTYGYFGGYRIVYITKYGDYVTEENILSWVDYRPEDGSIESLNKFYVSIKFGDRVVEFPGDISLSNGWAKDFEQTRYLGGSIEGDWNPGVVRTGTINGTIPVEKDAETVYLLRLLADYSGICHVRTPEGSNFYADVQVKDDREEKWVNKKSKISLTYTKVDGREDDLIVYSEWSE